MTNVMAVIVVTITTNWTTVSRTIPEPCGIPGCAVLHLAEENQVGAVTSNTVARFEWKGHRVEVVLDSVDTGRRERRAVAVEPCAGVWR